MPLAAGDPRPATSDRLPHTRGRAAGVPFARAGSRFTCVVEDLLAFLATKMDKAAIALLARIDGAPWTASVNARCDEGGRKMPPACRRLAFASMRLHGLQAL